MTLLDDLVAIADADDEPVVLSARHDALVVRVGALVVKAHRVSTDETDLRTRLSIVGDPLLSDTFVPPCGSLRKVRDRLVTVWPAGLPVDPTAPESVPWEDGARLLACLHAVPVMALPAGPSPVAGAPARVARAVARLPGHGSAADRIRRAYATLPAWARGERPAVEEVPLLIAGTRGTALTHGDWHLGQLVRAPGTGWRLIDIDDLGTGDPVWDLARPAALYAAGVLPPDDWERFLGAYRASGGCAVPTEGDPWWRLNTVAQALAVQMAATCVVMAGDESRPLDESETALVETCGRIVALRNPR